MSQISFQPLWRPQKISWIYPIDPNRTVLETIRSKHAKKFLAGTSLFLQQNNFEVSHGSCSLKEYEEFLLLYNQRINEKGFEPLATLEWFHAKKEEGKTVEKLFIRQNNVLVGGKIITTINHEFRSSFKASLQLPIFHKQHNASLGILLDYLMLEEYVKRKPTLLMAGTSRNLFGVINTMGYLIFKLRMGYQPLVINEKTVFEQETTNPEKSIWLTFLSESPESKKTLNLYYSGDLAQFAQLSELEKFIHPIPLDT